MHGKGLTVSGFGMANTPWHGCQTRPAVAVNAPKPGRGFCLFLPPLNQQSAYQPRVEQKCAVRRRRVSKPEPANCPNLEMENLLRNLFQPSTGRDAKASLGRRFDRLIGLFTMKPAVSDPKIRLKSALAALGRARFLIRSSFGLESCN